MNLTVTSVAVPLNDGDGLAAELPLCHAEDAATDVETLRAVPENFSASDERSVAWLVRRVVAARDYARHVKEYAEVELARAAREEKVLLFLFGRQAEEWVRDQISKSGGRRKSINMPGGTVGFRRTVESLVVDDEQAVMSWARTNCPEAIVKIERLSKTSLKAHLEATGEIPTTGAHVEPAVDRFFIR